MSDQVKMIKNMIEGDKKGIVYFRKTFEQNLKCANRVNSEVVLKNTLEFSLILEKLFVRHCFINCASSRLTYMHR